MTADRLSSWRESIQEVNLSTSYLPVYLSTYRDTVIVQPRAWYGMENGMEWNGNFGMEYKRCQNE